MMNDKSSNFYFDCRYWSDYVEEDEKLFIGGLHDFHFGTIRNMTTTPKENYRVYIQTLTMFHYMIEGWPWKDGKIKKKNNEALKLLIKEEIAGKAVKSLPSVVPRYVLQLWHHFLIKIKAVEIEWRCMDKEVVSQKKEAIWIQSIFGVILQSRMYHIGFPFIFGNSAKYRVTECV